MAKHFLPRFRIAIVGSGAIGCYYGGKLASFGRDVHFLMRSDTSAVRKSGLRIRSKTENIHVAKVNVHQTTAEIGPCDLVIDRGKDDLEHRSARAPATVAARSARCC